MLDSRFRLAQKAGDPRLRLERYLSEVVGKCAALVGP